MQKLGFSSVSFGWLWKELVGYQMWPWKELVCYSRCSKRRSFAFVHAQSNHPL